MKLSAQIKNLLVFALIGETICVSYALYMPSFARTISVLYTFAGIAIGVGLLWVHPSKPITSAHPKYHAFPSLFYQPIYRYRWLVMGIVLIAMCYFGIKWMEDAQLNYKDADMLPIIQTMCHRALIGNWSNIYDPIPEIWGGITPIYLPAMWLPFCFPEWLHIDIRWLTILSLFIVFCIFLWKVHPLQKQAFPLLLSCFLLFWWIFTNEKSGLIPYTEEGIVILYYAFLVYALTTRKAWLVGIAASFCVLSRYALIGWLPVMIVYFIYLKDWKRLIQFIIAGIACFVLLVLIPFGWHIFRNLFMLPSEYIAFAARVWHDAAHVFMESLGWAKFFGPGRIALLHYLLISLSFIIPMAYLIVVLGQQKKYHFTETGIMLSSLKITLVVFYSLIDVPYLYLFYTSSFVSLLGLAYFFQTKQSSKTLG